MARLKVTCFSSCPGEILLMSAETEKGRNYKIYMPQEMLQKLVDGIEKTQNLTKHLGHRFWHIENENYEKCSTCKKQ